MDRRSFFRLTGGTSAAVVVAAALPAAIAELDKAKAPPPSPAEPANDPVAPRIAPPPAPRPRAHYPHGMMVELPAHPTMPAPCLLYLRLRPWLPFRSFAFRFHGVRDRDVGRVQIAVDGHVVIWKGDAAVARALRLARGDRTPRGYLLIDFEGSALNHEAISELGVDLQLNGNAREPRVQWWGIT